MEKKNSALLDEHLVILNGVQETETDDFFYTRLRAKMDAKKSSEKGGWFFPLKPVWVISAMLLFLVVNILILNEKFKPTTTNDNTVSALQSFASSYDQSISSF